MTDSQSNPAGETDKPGKSAPSEGKGQPSRLRRILSRAGYALFLLVLAAVTVKSYDLYLLRQGPVPVAGYAMPEAVLEDPSASMQLYPYTGFHVLSHWRNPHMALMGMQPNELDIRTGDAGFLIDFDLQSPPPKAPGEFRIILIGGSAAQGLGGRSNEDMFYSRLEHKLNAALGPGGTKVRIINLAMAASITYQNYIALNRWGHPLQPDLILSFAGHNDLQMTLRVQRTDIPFCYEDCMGLVEACKDSSSGPGLAWLTRLLPGIFGRTQAGTAVRVLRLDEHAAHAQAQYRASGACGDLYGRRLWVHALQSIKRDFNGIPIVVALQPSHEPDVMGEFPGLAQAYASELKGYRNGDWRLVDFQRQWLDQGRFDQTPPLLVDPCHLSSAGHEVVATTLAEELTPMIRALVARKAAAATAPATVSPWRKPGRR